MRHPDSPERPCRLSAIEALRRFRAGTLTPEELLADCLDRIAEREPDVRAWAHLDPAIARAGLSSARATTGPLRGIPVGVKDVFDTSDQPTGYGSALYRGFRPRRDAAAVAALRASGAVVLGKTVTAELAWLHPGGTRNPHDLARTPGGSSSGSAAAVADGMVPLAIGTQTGGSIVRPAAFCGVVGYKPSFGWVPRAGCLPFSPSLDTVGGFARTVEDVALLGAALTGRFLPTAGSAAPPRLGVDRTDQWALLEPDARAAFERVVDRVADTGAQVDEVDVADEAVLDAPQRTVLTFEAARSLAHERITGRDAISAALRDVLDAGASVDPADYDAAQTIVRAARRETRQRLADLDAVLTPSALGTAPADLTTTGDPACNRIWTLLGVPCLHLPLERGADGMPLGVQLVGAHARDAAVVAAGAWICDRCPRA